MGIIKVFANNKGERDSIPDQVILKTQKMVLDAILLNSHKVWIKGKWNNPGEGVVSFPTSWCSSYWKGSLWVALNCSRPTYFLYIESEFIHENITINLQPDF